MTTKPTTRKIAGKIYILKRTTHNEKEAKAAASDIRKKYGKGTGVAKKLGEGLYAVYQLQTSTKRAATKTESTQKAQLPKWKPKSPTFRSGELLSTISSRDQIRVSQKLAAGDKERRSRAAKMWSSGEERGTMREIYLRLYERDLKKLTK